jgi:putative hydrolase of the HAD superfamily
MLRRLPGRKIVFSNAPTHYADAVLKAMGVRRFFDSVWCQEQLRFVPKPFPETFRRLLHRERLHATQCVMVEDSIDNLRTARRLGMKTVLVSRTGAPAWVDVGVKSVLELPRQIERL